MGRRYKITTLVLLIIVTILLVGTPLLTTLVDMNKGEFLLALLLLSTILYMSVYLLAVMCEDIDISRMIEKCGQHRYIYKGYYVSNKEFVNKIYFKFKCVKCGKYLELSEDDIVGDLIMLSESLEHKKSLGETSDEYIKESTIAIPRYDNVPNVFTCKEVTLLLAYYEQLGIGKNQFMKISPKEIF